MADDEDDDLQGGSVLRFDDGHFFSFLQDDYVLPVPSHPPELDRLRLTHAILTETIGLVPPEVGVLLAAGGHRVLDVGSGTGQWAREVAEAYPGCEVNYLNCHFRIHDIIRGLPCPDGSVDIVRAAGMLLGIHDYPALLRECARVLRSGGYLLLRENEYAAGLLGDFELEDHAPAVALYFETFRAALSERGLSPWGGYGLAELVRGVAGLHILQDTRSSVPLGVWPTDATLRRHGALSREIFQLLADSTRVMFHDHGVGDVEAMRDAAVAEVDEGRDGLVWMYDVVVARRI